MITTSEKKWLIWTWWIKKVTNGQQLTNYAEWQEGYDYKERDEDGWSTWIATEALLAEFNRCHIDNPIKQTNFTTHLKKILVVCRSRSVLVKCDIDGYQAKARRSFLIFKSRQWYLDRLYLEGYYYCFR